MRTRREFKAPEKLTETRPSISLSRSKSSRLSCQKKKKERKEGRVNHKKADPTTSERTYLTSGTAPITTTLSKATTRVDKIFERIFFLRFVKFGWLVSHSRPPLDERFLYARHIHTHTHTET